jgi:hypothetical protein
MHNNKQVQNPKKTSNVSPEQRSTRLHPLTRPTHPASIIQQARESPDSLTPADVLQLQRTIGNQAVGHLLSEISRLPSTTLQSPVQRQEEGVQAKLTVNAPNDVYEQEADRVAETVTKAVNSPVQRQEEEAFQAKAALETQRQELPEEELQAQLAESQDTTVSESFETHINHTRGSGHPLSDNVREPMEQEFGADFSGVRLHTDSEADVLNQQLSANAFTTGQDIFFREGEYSPKSESGQKLLAHELTHTMQQGTSNRISPWWPKGHRHITRKVFSATKQGKLYDMSAQNYLATRSADMDFMQDEVNAMEQGRKASEPLIKDFKDQMQYLRRLYGEKIKTTKSIKYPEGSINISFIPHKDEKLLNELGKKWDENKLHVRRPWYMMHHGEGGFYHASKETGAAKNKALTDNLVNTAIELYKAQKFNVALSVLSDALHQAEDRGSHQEGAEFKGHDIRKTEIHPRLIPETATRRPVGKYFDPGWDPDNAEKNKDGAKYALKFASDVLTNFSTKVGGTEERPIKLAEDKRKPQIRHASFKGLVPVESTGIAVKTKGETREKIIDNLTLTDWKELKDDVKDLTAPEQEEVAEGMKVYVSLWIESELIGLFGIAEGVLKWTHEERLEFAKKHFDKIIGQLPLFGEHVEGKEERILTRAVANWEYFIGLRKQPGKKKEDQ